ncbi:site-specific integrase [Rhodococcus sp. BP-252]|uniref:tyrosine-type recombinase/integrase n=1 Tax=unclassified Rhodococcus (in: high G+C Gram-positive bacteria) TaxID=192944 RepID=UPI001C9A67D7|nr:MULTISPECIES: site-specific integrase [unclassified Rhodococcus (in: high G+C Gram-positive bacteria)]MBY6414828.1 site-specific integrase [Rhodococcus sp. BP-320]MBY6419731.1 site-specific integrase [Rhodococcus sp. BP-321]MBY6424700.1 site-specific integrase [Rhodococcus sp. BP-324]MBY6429706.1 site-specific integrase [Rhodococcus sp. BP-323]MBY6434678.1 site-specific integrase [Rhodococcus sp. BP-322]
MRKRGLRLLTEYLGKYPGVTWQHRWEASELNTRCISPVDLTDNVNERASLGQALGALYALRVIRPTLPAFLAGHLKKFVDDVLSVEDDPLLDAYVASVRSADVTQAFKTAAIADVCIALIVQGIHFNDLTPEAFLHHAMQVRQTRSRSGLHLNKYIGHLAWQTLCSCGHFPAHTPPTLRGALRSPQLTTTEMVDRHGAIDPDVRQMFIDYLDRRSNDVKYSTLNVIATNLVKSFWKSLVTINPGQADLRVSDEHYRQWRATANVREDGTPRSSPWVVLSMVQALYYDIQAWAVNEPQQWARWSAPCPITRTEMRSHAAHKRRSREQTHGEIRTRQPLLPVLVEHVNGRYEHWRGLLERASATEDKGTFVYDGDTFTRVITRGDAQLIRENRSPRVHVLPPGRSKVLDVGRQEDAAFWTWAIVETLRFSGIRIEELTELSQLSVRQYQRPNGEVIALLVIAPSKTDRERVIPMSAELFHVIACVVRRIGAGGNTVPLATRYDDYERTTSDPQPFLFQRNIGQRIEAMTPKSIGVRLRHVCERLAETDPRFADAHFRPHDFRRLFATDLVNNGLPIHIGAALLGHLDLNTTRGYVAVFEEDVTRHYQAHLERRRALRPQDEYKPVTAEEWTEFETHFDKRKIELGSCGRPYATPCSHEHACIRCPMLHVDPKMVIRLTAIENDLEQRRARALAENWLGEVEGLDLTLTFLRAKRDEVERTRRRTTSLGLPTLPANKH